MQRLDCSFFRLFFIYIFSTPTSTTYANKNIVPIQLLQSRLDGIKESSSTKLQISEFKLNILICSYLVHIVI